MHAWLHAHLAFGEMPMPVAGSISSQNPLWQSPFCFQDSVVGGGKNSTSRLELASPSSQGPLSHDKGIFGGPGPHSVLAQQVTARPQTSWVTAKVSLAVGQACCSAKGPRGRGGAGPWSARQL